MAITEQPTECPGSDAGTSVGSGELPLWVRCPMCSTFVRWHKVNRTMDGGQIVVMSSHALPERLPPAGVWAAYAYDYGPYLLSVHPTEVEALRTANNSYGHPVFLPWGVSLADAIKTAEAKV